MFQAVSVQAVSDQAVQCFRQSVIQAVSVPGSSVFSDSFGSPAVMVFWIFMDSLWSGKSLIARLSKL